MIQLSQLSVSYIDTIKVINRIKIRNIWQIIFGN